MNEKFLKFTKKGDYLQIEYTCSDGQKIGTRINFRFPPLKSEFMPDIDKDKFIKLRTENAINMITRSIFQHHGKKKGEEDIINGGVYEKDMDYSEDIRKLNIDKERLEIDVAYQRLKRGTGSVEDALKTGRKMTLETTPTGLKIKKLASKK